MALVNLASRSRMRKRKEPIRSPRSMSRLRADTGGVIRTTQVTGLFDLIAIIGAVARGTWQVHRRYMAGPSEVSGSQRRAGSRFIRGRSLHSAGHARAGRHGPAARRGSAMKHHGARQRNSATVQGDTPRSAGSPRLPPDPAGCAWARLSTTSELPGLAGPSPRTAGHLKTVEPAVR
jgi:hypothetical protein